MRLNLATDYEDWRRIYFASNDDDDDGGGGGDDDDGAPADDGTGGDPTGGGQDPGGGLGASDRYTGDGDDTGPTSDPTGGSQDPAGGGGGPSGFGGTEGGGGGGPDTGGGPADTGGGPADTGGGPADAGGVPGVGGGPADTGGGPADTGGGTPAADVAPATDRTGPQSEAAASAALGTDTRFTAGGGAAAGQAPEAGGVTTDVAGTLAGATPASTGGPGPGLGGATTAEALAGVDPNVAATLADAPPGTPPATIATTGQVGLNPEFPWGPGQTPDPTPDPEVDQYTNPFAYPGTPGPPGGPPTSPFGQLGTFPERPAETGPPSVPGLPGEPPGVLSQGLPANIRDVGVDPGIMLPTPPTPDRGIFQDPSNVPGPNVGVEQDVSLPGSLFSTPARAGDLMSADAANLYVGQAAQAGEFQAPANPANWGVPGIAAAQNMPDVSTNTTLPAWTGSAAPPGNAAAFGGYETITPSFDPNANLDPQALQAANEQPWTGAPSPAPVAGNMLGRAPNMPGSLGRSNDPTAPGLGRVIDSSGWGASVGSIQAGDYNFDPSNPNVGVNPGLNVAGDTPTYNIGNPPQATGDLANPPEFGRPVENVGTPTITPDEFGFNPRVAPASAGLGPNAPAGLGGADVSLLPTQQDPSGGQPWSGVIGQTIDASGTVPLPNAPGSAAPSWMPGSLTGTGIGGAAGPTANFPGTSPPAVTDSVPLPTPDPRGPHLPSGDPILSGPNVPSPLDTANPPFGPGPAPSPPTPPDTPTPPGRLAGPSPPVAGPDDVGGVTPNVADQLASPGGTDGGELSYGGGGGGGGGFFPIANSLMQPIPKDGTPPDGNPPAPDGNPPDGGIPPFFPSLEPFPNNPEEGLWAPNPGVQPGAVPPGGIPLANALNNAVDLGGG